MWEYMKKQRKTALIERGIQTTETPEDAKGAPNYAASARQDRVL